MSDGVDDPGEAGRPAVRAEIARLAQQIYGLSLGVQLLLDMHDETGEQAAADRAVIRAALVHVKEDAKRLSESIMPPRGQPDV